MTATIPEDAIDPEIWYREWVKQYLWHIDQLPLLMETTATLAIPRLGVSRGGSQFDRPQVTGGGYYDTIPLADGGATEDSRTLWAAMCAYVRAVSGHVEGAPLLALTAPDEAGVARAAAYSVTGWLADHVDTIAELHVISSVEDELFALIRRLRGRYTAAGTHRRARPRLCTTCGEHAVIVDWIDGANGSPKPVQVGVCKACGETYTDAAAAPTAAEPEGNER